MTNRKEFWLVVAGIMVLTTGVSWAGKWFPFIGGWSALIIALLFLYVPIEVLERRGFELKTFGLWRGNLKTNLRQCFWVSLIVFIPYAFCFHFWQVDVMGKTASFEARHILDWPLEFEGKGEQKRTENAFRTQMNGDQVLLDWQFDDAEANTEKIQINIAGDARIFAQMPHEKRSEQQDHLSFERSASRGHLQLRTKSTTLEIEVFRNGKRLAGGAIQDGYHQAIGENPIQVNRNWWWLFHFILGQLILVALPEEVFYRGYIQTRLEERFPRRTKCFGVKVSWPALIGTSTIFAIGHILTIPHPARLAVFFPSLLFGWMRTASGSVVSAICFHALCNLFAQLAFKFYFA